MTNEPTNADRASWAKNALAAFTAETFGGGHPDTIGRHDLDSAISDLIADLLHYAVQQGLDVGNLMQRACGHFGYELLEEACRGATKPAAGIVSSLVEALHVLLEQTIDRDLKYGISLTEGESEARAKALEAIAAAVEAGYGELSAISRSTR